jgi:uncharacterized protein YigA (DUF484 family)
MLYPEIINSVDVIFHPWSLSDSVHDSYFNMHTTKARTLALSTALGSYENQHYSVILRRRLHQPISNRPLGLVVKRITSIQLQSSKPQTWSQMIRSLVRFWQRAFDHLLVWIVVFQTFGVVAEWLSRKTRNLVPSGA